MYIYPNPFRYHTYLKQILETQKILVWWNQAQS